MPITRVPRFSTRFGSTTSPACTAGGDGGSGRAPWSPIDFRWCRQAASSRAPRPRRMRRAIACRPRNQAAHDTARRACVLPSPNEPVGKSGWFRITGYGQHRDDGPMVCMGSSGRFHQPPPSAWNSAALSTCRAACACARVRNLRSDAKFYSGCTAPGFLDTSWGCQGMAFVTIVDPGATMRSRSERDHCYAASAAARAAAGVRWPSRSMSHSAL
jgi:hypothetical protein